MKDRIYQIIEITCKGSIRKFAEAIGVPYANIYNYYREDRKSSNKVTADIIAKIVLSFDDFNVDWILTGRGEMLKKINVEKSANEMELIEKLEEAREEIGYYKGILIANGLSPAPFPKKGDSA